MLYKYLPYFVFKALFGDRRKFGLKPNFNDPDFVKWRSKQFLKCYEDTQKKGIGKIVNSLGYSIMRYIDLRGKIVLELGPGIMEHLRYSKTKPEKYILVDVKQEFLEITSEILKSYGVYNIKSILVKDNRIDLPLDDESVDIIITFYQLEHIYELDKYLSELKRILRPKGIIVGAVPCEGGLAWGLGRFLTSRRYTKRLGINYDKIICWEHPNFVDRIKFLLDKNFVKIKSIKKPFPILPFDLNLIWAFIYQKK